MDTNIGSSLFQGASVNIDNAGQNLEEEEELEDLKRRQEEIQSLLTKAMDDFNYDDQSTVNTSVNESVEYEQQYKVSNLDNQLEVMYNIRVKEVESLSEKMQVREQQLADMKAQMMQSLMLSEAENDKLRTSLKNSQELLVEKCNEIQQLNHDNHRILLDIESFKQILAKLETERVAVDYNNQELREKVAILEKGRALNPLTDAVLQETHHVEVSKLQHNLDAAFCKNERLEKENVALTEKLNAVVSEKTDLLANKTEVINKLMQNLDQAQEHNGELLNNVTRLSTENERFRMQVQELEASVHMLKGFTDKTEIIKILQKELEKSKNLTAKQTIEFEKLHQEYSDLLKDNKAKDVHIQLLEENIAGLERKPTTESHAMQTSTLMESFSVSNKLRDELETYKSQCQEQFSLLSRLQQENKLLEDDISNLNRKLELSAQRDSLTAALQEKAIRLEQIILNNKKPPCESKSTNTDTDASPTPPATPHNGEPSEAYLKVYKTKFETELIVKEIELRKQLQAEFEKQYEIKKVKPATCAECSKLLKDIAENEELIKELRAQVIDNVIAKQKDIDANVCAMCHEMSVNLMQNLEVISNQENELEQHRINQEKDKLAIVQMLGEWKKRFQHVEQQNHELHQHSESLAAALGKAQEELDFYRRSEKDLVHMVQRKAQMVVANWSAETLQQVRLHNQHIRATKAKIDDICRQTDGRVKEIEQDFDKAHLQLKRSVSMNSK